MSWITVFSFLFFCCIAASSSYVLFFLAHRLERCSQASFRSAEAIALDHPWGIAGSQLAGLAGLEETKRHNDET